MAVAFSGGLSGTMTEVIVPSRASEYSPVCGGTISSDAAGANYLLNGSAGSDVPSLSFAIHRTQAPGSYAVGPYPDGTAAAPAVVNVLILRDGQGFASWNSGGGSLVIDPGGRSGTLTADLGFAGWRRQSVNASPPPTTTLPALHVQGSWICPAGS
jgi:hypothetical protein